MSKVRLSHPHLRRKRNPSPAAAGQIAALSSGDQYSSRDDNFLSPSSGDAAKIRPFFVHPSWVRKGLGKLVLDACEEAAREAGFKKAEMGATLSGVPFYGKMGYKEVEN